MLTIFRAVNWTPEGLKPQESLDICYVLNWLVAPEFHATRCDLIVTLRRMQSLAASNGHTRDLGGTLGHKEVLSSTFFCTKMDKGSQS